MISSLESRDHCFYNESLRAVQVAQSGPSGCQIQVKPAEQHRQKARCVALSVLLECARTEADVRPQKSWPDGIYWP